MAQAKKDKGKRDEYDSPWKEAIEQFLPDFLAFFFPEAAAGIDWTKGYEFLDKEFQKIVRQALTKQRRVDKLVKVWKKPASWQESELALSVPKGQTLSLYSEPVKETADSTAKETAEEGLVYIHVDVQGEKEDDFDKRMFIYHYRIFDRYEKPVATFVIYGDDNKEWQPKEYGYQLWGCKIKLEYPSVKLRDYRKKIDELEKDPNPFAVVVLAHLHTKATAKKPKERFDLKWRLSRMLYERGYSKEKIMSLYRFIDWMMALPKDLEKKFTERLNEYEEEQKMRYVTNMERFGVEKGIKIGVRQNVLKVLRLRFRNVSLPPTLVQSVESIDDAAVLDMLHEQSILADSFPTFEKKLAEVMPKKDGN